MRKPFSIKLSVTFALLLIAAVLVFSLIFYKNAERQALLSATDALEANTQQMAYLLDDLFYQMDILSLQLTSASDLQIYFQQNLNPSITNSEFKKVVNKAAAQFATSFKHSARILIYCPDGSYSSIGIPSQSRKMNSFFHSDEFPAWYALRNSFLGYITLLPPQKDMWSDKDCDFISFIRRLNNPFSFEQIGLIEIQISPSLLQSIADSICFSQSKYYLLDKNGHIYLSSDPDSINTADLYTLEYQDAQSTSFQLHSHELTSAIRLENSGLVLIQSQSKSEALNILGSYGIKMVSICVILVFLFLLLVFFLIGILTRPLHDLQRALQEISPGLKTDCFRDEFSFIQTSFLSLKDQLDAAISEAVTAKSRQDHAQLVALQAQIDPHLMFNMISVISSTAVANEDYQVYDISSAFSDMLRYILTDPSESVSLFTEIQHCRSYLSIMKYRYENQLDAEIICPAAIRDCPLPKLSLQPLLENCFKHGFNKALPPYSIRLCVEEHAGGISLQIRDNGSGMSTAKLAELKASVLQPTGAITRTDSVGIGLRSTYLRLQQMYKDTTMDMQSAPMVDFVFRCVSLSRFVRKQQSDVQNAESDIRSADHYKREE